MKRKKVKMSLLSKLKALFAKAKTEATEAKLTIAEFVTKYKTQIATAMKLVDTIYDNNQGSTKMQAVIKLFIAAINAKCGLSIDAGSVGTSATTAIEAEYEKVYQSLKS
jgi:hypothetical protein